MTTTPFPVILDGREGHLLISPNGKHLVRFGKDGHHQMVIQHWKLVNGQWGFDRGGFNWIGNARNQYSSLKAKGYRKP